MDLDDPGFDANAAWISRMRDGDLPGAWAVSDRVLARRHAAGRDDPSVPYHERWVWDGRAFRDRSVLVRCYHGLGDTLQFARYLRLLRRSAASVTLECQPELLPLLATCAGIDRLVPFDRARPAPPQECDIEIMELAFALRVPPQAAGPPYLHALPAPLPNGTLGLCWAAGAWDAERAIPPSLFERFGHRSCVSLVPGPTDVPVLNPEGSPPLLTDVAALVAGVDLVITTDTMIAHLAGALDRPTWLLLKHDADWRWMAGRRDSPWYPSMRFYRQPAPGDWLAVVECVAQDLASLRS